MKKLSTIIMALALVLGMSQCKKQETPTSTGNNTEGTVHITVKVDGKDGKDNNGEKHNIAPANGLFAFSNGDIIYVGHGGKYVGSLEFNNGFFEGDISDPTVTDQPLHFYFVGNAAVTGTPEANETTSLSISIADQSENLPVLSYGASNEFYTGLNKTYSTTLKNKCALVRINLLTPTTDAIMLSNVLTEATIDFANNAITPTNTTGDITLYGEESVDTHRWAILLPGTNLSNCNVIWQGAGNMPSIDNNTYVNAGINEGIQIQNQIVVELPNADLVVKDKNDDFSVFTVNGDGKKVYFSRANLKCNTENTNALVWSFHENQWDECFGTKTGTSSEPADQGSSVNMTNSSVMDRFSWGLHSPTTTGESDYVDGSKDLNRPDGTDWGYALTGQGNNHWRTLTADEWNYLLNNTDRGSRRFLKACIKIAIPKAGGGAYTTYVNGLFIAPDNFDPTAYGYTPGHTTNDDYAFVADNQWNKKNTVVDLTSGYMSMGGNGNKIAQHLFYAGCVFLPGVGYRTTMYINYFYYHNCITTSSSFEGYYWSATAEPVTPGVSSTPYAHALKFTKAAIPDSFSDTRDRGMCVRLVWDAN